jgi:hypothetical protein
MSGYSTYTPLIQAKLEALNEIEAVAGVGGNPGTPAVKLFSEVRYGAKNEFIGFPTAEFFKKAGSGQVEDTHRNLREWQYTLLLIYQFGSNKDREAVETLLDSTIDKVLDAFDKDQDLGGTCMKVEVTPVMFSDILLEEPFIFAEMTISIKDLVNRQ